MSRSVVITGIGPVTAYGLGIEPLWKGMLEGRSAIARISSFNPCGFPCKFAAELPADELDIRKLVPRSYRKATKVMCRDIELAVAAAAAAVEDAGLVTKGSDPDADPTIPPERMGCHIGAGLISADANELGASLIASRTEDGEFDMKHWGEQGMQNLTPLWLLKYLPNMLACHVTIVHDCRGPSNTITCCEASSALSLGESLRVIQRGAADLCLTGGAEDKLNLLAFLRQVFTGRLAATSADADPTAILRPFDRNAGGTLLGEGGGILILEDAETAQQRGARPYAEVTGFAATQCFCPDTSGADAADDDESLSDAMEHAIDQAKLKPGDIDAIAPLGASTPFVDAAEASAIRRVFGDRASSIPLITTIPFAGHCGAGNGAVALSVAARCLREQKLPARLNTRGNEALDANETPAREAELEHILVTTTSQGGQNAAVILKRIAS